MNKRIVLAIFIVCGLMGTAMAEDEPCQVAFNFNLGFNYSGGNSTLPPITWEYYLTADTEYYLIESGDKYKVASR